MLDSRKPAGGATSGNVDCDGQHRTGGRRDQDSRQQQQEPPPPHGHAPKESTYPTSEQRPASPTKHDIGTFPLNTTLKAGCPNQSTQCLCRLPVANLAKNFPRRHDPGVVDSLVLTEPIGTAMAAGWFARVPILNGIYHAEEQIFVDASGVTGGGIVLCVPRVSSVTVTSSVAILAVRP